MSAEGEKPKPSVCENFEPQAWRKTICKNCFQPPDKHVPGETTGAPGPAGKENKPPAVPEKPKPGMKTGVDEKNVAQKSDKDKTGTSLAHSIKDKYEQLEKDKYGPKEAPKVAPKTANKPKPGLSSITDKYEKLKDDSKMADSTKLKGESKTNENIPSSNQSKKDTLFGSKFPGKKDDSTERPKSLNKSKFGSVENLSKTDEKQKVDFRLTSKSKFGSMENVSGAEKTKEPIQIPIQRSKFGGSVESLSTDKSNKNVSHSDLAKRTLLNKLDDFSNELKAGATSKAGSTVIHKQSDGNIDVIPIPKKSNTPKPIDNEALQNEMNELKMSRIGDKSGQIKPQIDKQSKLELVSKHGQADAKQSGSLRHDSSPTKSVSPDRKPGLKIDLGKSDESCENRQLVRRNSGFKLDIGTPNESPEIKPGFKIDFKKSDSPTKDPKRRNSGFKLEFEKSESPTKEPLRKSPEKKSGLKMNFDKSESPTKDPGERKSGFKLNLSPSPTKEIVNLDDKSKLDLRSALKKAESKQNETSKSDKSEGKQKFELPFLKSSKERKDEPKKDSFCDNKHKDSIKTSETEQSTNKNFNSSIKSPLSDSKGKTIDFDIKKVGLNDKTETLKISSEKTTETFKPKVVDSEIPIETISPKSENEKLNADVKDVEVKAVVNDSNVKSKSPIEVSINVGVKTDSNISNDKSKSESLTDEQKETRNRITDQDSENKLVSKTADEIGKTISIENMSPQKDDIEEKPLVISDNNNKPPSEETGNKKDFQSVEKINMSEKESIQLNQNEKEKENNEADKVLIHDKQNQEKGKESRDSLSLKTEAKNKDKNGTHVETTKIDVDSHEKDKKDSAMKNKDSKENTERKGQFELPKLKSKDGSKKEDDRSSFKKNDPINVQENKSKKANEIEDKLQPKDSKMKSEPKRKVESPFLKSIKVSEEDKKTPIDDKKKPLETKSNKTFEVPKLKSAKSDEKDGKFSKPESKFSKTEEPKRKFDVPSLKSNKDDKDKKDDRKWGLKQEEPKKKFELPTLKSKQDDKDKSKTLDKAYSKSDEKKKAFEVSKLKSSQPKETEKKDEKLNIFTKKDEPKKKFELPNLKSSKQDDKSKQNEKQGIKSQPEEPKNKVLDRLNLKSAKDEKSDSLAVKDPKKNSFEIEKQNSNTFERPKLKSAKDHKVLNEKCKTDEKTEKVEKHINLDKNKQDEKSKSDSEFKSAAIKSKTEDKKSKFQSDFNDSSKETISKDPKETFQEKHKGEDERETSVSTVVDKTKSIDASSTSTIGTENFESISADIDGRLTDEDYACANDSASDDNYLHVDTQVFTSSRNKTAEVTGEDRTDLSISGTKDLDFILSKRGSKEGDSFNFSPGDNLSKEEGRSKSSKNGNRSPSPVSVYISSEIENDSGVQKDISGEKGAFINENEITRLRRELLLMTERCSNLEKENTTLRDGLDRKDSDQIKLKQQKDEVENVIKGLKGKIQSMEDICEQLEYDNKNLKNSLKDHVDKSELSKEAQKGIKSVSETNGISENENDLEEIMEENEQLKQEIAELKLEMDEMYDSFRDQEAEEFRELQKELEITAKNCRILQFKLRKLERHNDQVEHDRNEFESRLRRLQDQFQDRDAVSHIHSLEDELRMAKDVSVRLHDELDLLEEKRGKMEEENRHLTELLEQADRKQFRLELEVDKLRDKVMQLRTELSAAKDPNSTEPRKLNCAEFLALHREVI